MLRLCVHVYYTIVCLQFSNMLPAVGAEIRLPLPRIQRALSKVLVLTLFCRDCFSGALYVAMPLTMKGHSNVM